MPRPALADLKAEVQAKLDTLVKTTKTMTWTHTTYEKKGKDIERTQGNVWWQGVDLQRIEVTGGRGEGHTVILTGKRLDTGMITFDFDSRMVLSLRGNTVRQNGYLDDLALALQQWDRATVAEEAGLWVLGYTTGTGLPSKLWLNPQSLAATKNESTQNGEVVERYEYTNVKYNPALPKDIFED
jgi:outer membrane lipoprotein-sorting protein